MRPFYHNFVMRDSLFAEPSSLYARAHLRVERGGDGCGDGDGFVGGDGRVVGGVVYDGGGGVVYDEDSGVVHDDGSDVIYVEGSGVVYDGGGDVVYDDGNDVVCDDGDVGVDLHGARSLVIAWLEVFALARLLLLTDRVSGCVGGRRQSGYVHALES